MSSVYEYRAIIKDTLMHKLYYKQLQKWNKALLELSRKNSLSLGRTHVSHIPQAIWFRNKKWLPEELDWSDSVEISFCTQLNPDYPEYAILMAEIADELSEIKTEKYESERFLSGLVLFNAPPNVYEKVLGNTLFSAISSEVYQHCKHYNGVEFKNDCKSTLITYVKTNTNIIQTMNERLMLNLIT